VKDDAGNASALPLVTGNWQMVVSAQCFVPTFTTWFCAGTMFVDWVIVACDMRF